jgi:aspartate/tyrosine/aromatic aminotransferase
MRERVKGMRKAFTQSLQSLGLDFDFSHITAQNGMFSYSGLSKDTVIWLREHKSISQIPYNRLHLIAMSLQIF